jgi:uncharacterized protein
VHREMTRFSFVEESVAVTEGLLEAGTEGWRLLGGRCDSCGEPHFPRTDSCPYCSSAEIATTPLPSQGTLWGWTAVTAAPPGYEGEVPFGFGVVELDGRLRIITRLTEPDPARLRHGQPMRLAVVAVGGRDGQPVVTYAFAPNVEDA